MKHYDTFEQANLLSKLGKMLNIIDDDKNAYSKINTAIEMMDYYCLQDLCELVTFLCTYFAEKLPDTILQVNNINPSERHCLKSLKDFISVFEKEESNNETSRLKE